MVAEDLLWLEEHCMDDEKPSECYTRNWIRHFRHLTAHQGHSLINRACVRYVSWQADCIRHRLWQKQLSFLAEQLQLRVPAFDNRPPAEGNRFVCYECRAISKDITAWKAHRTKAHVGIDAAERYCRGSGCPGCAKQFHTRPRLLHHLRHKRPVCLAVACQFFAPLSVGSQ